MYILGVIVLLIGVVFIVLSLAYLYGSRAEKKYWRAKGVEFFPHILFLNMKAGFQNRHFVYNLDSVYKEMKAKKVKFMACDGMGTKTIVIKDIEILKMILIKDFDHFMNRRLLVKKGFDNLLNKMLFFLQGKEWKHSRIRLSPTFTTGKIKRVFKVFEKSSQKLVNYISKGLEKNDELDCIETVGKYSLDVIAEATFGIDSKALDSPTIGLFEKMTSKLNLKLSVGFLIKVILLSVAPRVANKLGVFLFDKDAENFLLSLLRDSIKQRREHDLKMNDFLQILLEARKSESKVATSDLEQYERDALLWDQSVDVQFDDEFIVYQISMFLLAGFETTRSLLSHILYLLAIHPDVQEKLYEEISNSCKSSECFTYEDTMKMLYLDQVINETLRLYPPSSATERLCTKSYTIPSADLTIEKGTIVSIPIWSIQRDSEHYDNPESFRPERFSPENRKDSSPYTFLPFGHGPRNCIGMRFALAETKLGLCHLVNNFQFQPCKKTSTTLVFGSSNVLRPRDGIRLQTKHR